MSLLYYTIEGRTYCVDGTILNAMRPKIDRMFGNSRAFTEGWDGIELLWDAITGLKSMCLRMTEVKP